MSVHRMSVIPRSTGELEKTGETRMARLKVRILLPLLQVHLSNEDKVPITDGEVRQFLLDSGFTPDGEYWIVDEKDLGQLDPSEVAEAMPID
jgi:hypothetical protein